MINSENRGFYPALLMDDTPNEDVIQYLTPLTKPQNK